MLRRHEISDADWERIEHLLPGQAGQHGGVASDNRRFVNAVLWIARTGSPWRDLPERLGNWNSQWRRFDRWAKRGRFAAIAEVLRDPDLDVLILDSTVVRAHPCAAGAPQARGGQAAQALGRSRGGFSTKIHIVVDALGNPLRCTLTGGQAHDITQAPILLAGLVCGQVIADKGYDATEFVTTIEAQGAVPVIPPRSNRKTPRTYDTHVYQERHLVECFINKIKHYRRIFARFDKLDQRFLDFLHFVATLIWLR